MLFNCYLKNSIVYVPTVGKRGGAYTDIEPVSVVPLTDSDGLRHAFLAAIRRGNVTVPYLKGKYPPPAVLKYVGVKSWSAFTRNASSWSIKERNEGYQIVGYRMHSDGYWVEDQNQKIEFPPGTAVEVVVDHLIGILQEAAAKP